jgi:hypothetical protein
MTNDGRQQFLDELQQKLEANVGRAAAHLAGALAKKLPRSIKPRARGHTADRVTVKRKGTVARVIVPAPWGHNEFGNRTIPANPVVRRTVLEEAERVQSIVATGA